MKNLIPIVTVMICTFQGFALADGGEPGDLPSDSRIKVLMYDEADVYTITTRYGYQTNIVFALGEEVQTISVGDRSMWQIIPASNRLFIRPMEDGVTTNMTVLTNKHSYQFDLKSVASDAKSSGNIYVAKFIYPEEKHKTPPMLMSQPSFAPAPTVTTAEATPTPMPSSMTAPLPAPVETQTPSDPNRPPGATKYYAPPPKLHTDTPEPAPTAADLGMTRDGSVNYNYTFEGPDDLSPLQVYDDGKVTTIRYRDPNQPLPNVYAVDNSGNESQIHYSVKDGAMMIDTVTAKLALKNSDGTVYVYNEMLNPR